MFAAIATAVTPFQMISGGKYNITLFIIIKILAFNQLVLHFLKFPVVPDQYFLFHRVT